MILSPLSRDTLGSAERGARNPHSRASGASVAAQDVGLTRLSGSPTVKQLDYPLSERGRALGTVCGDDETVYRHPRTGVGGSSFFNRSRLGAGDRGTPAGKHSSTGKDDGGKAESAEHTALPECFTRESVGVRIVP